MSAHDEIGNIRADENLKRLDEIRKADGFPEIMSQDEIEPEIDSFQAAIFLCIGAGAVLGGAGLIWALL